ncbi:hypothetical protein ACH9EU_16910 [Kocuria sp. M1R5S2]|uniref:hypothetical protein n=1 Tax=Kocuria rhizosphaerae TaxID=3376285 RepID=UPI0037A6A17E
MKFNTPPNWPAPPAGWTPPSGWNPPEEWAPAPEGWNFWAHDDGAEPDEPVGTDRGPSGSAQEASQWSSPYGPGAYPQSAAYGMSPMHPGPHPYQDLRSMPGWRHRSNSIIVGIVGLVFSFSLIGPFVFGPVGLVQASRAESMGVAATGGKVLGVINLIVGILVAFFFLALLGV